jgi:hypothetical protein
MGRWLPLCPVHRALPRPVEDLLLSNPFSEHVATFQLVQDLLHSGVHYWGHEGAAMVKQLPFLPASGRPPSCVHAGPDA